MEGQDPQRNTPAGPPGLEFRLDDRGWQTLRIRRRQALWGATILYSGIAAVAIFRLGSGNLALVPWMVGGFVVGGIGLIGFVRVFHPPDPDRMQLTETGIVFHRPNGRQFTLGLGKGTKVRLLDQSVYLSASRLLGSSSAPYFMTHSATVEQVVLTRESFLAIEEALESRGAILVGKRPMPLIKGSTEWSYVM